MHADRLDPDLVRDTLSVILKRQSDILDIAGKADQLTRTALEAAAGPG
jgi:hypothetical protein